MKWLIAVGVIGFMLAPLMWILPTPQQMRQSRIRDHARRCGLVVKVVDLPQTRRQIVRKEEPRPGLCYTLPLVTRNAPTPWRYWFNQSVYDGDDDSPLPAQEVVEAIKYHSDCWPADSTMLECQGHSLNIYWRERAAEVETVEKLAEGLKNLREGLKLES